jgi:hypothetical protein
MQFVPENPFTCHNINTKGEVPIAKYYSESKH